MLPLALCCEGSQSGRCGGTSAGSVARSARPSFLSGRPCCGARVAAETLVVGTWGSRARPSGSAPVPLAALPRSLREGRPIRPHTHSRTHTLSLNSGTMCRRPEPCTAVVVPRGTLSHAAGAGSYPEIIARSRNVASRRCVSRSRVHATRITKWTTKVDYPVFHDRRDMHKSNSCSIRAKRKPGTRLPNETKIEVTNSPNETRERSI